MTLVPYRLKPQTLSIALDKIEINLMEMQVLLHENCGYIDADKNTLELMVTKNDI